MSKIPNINFTVKNDLCVGCGVCQDTCPQKAISIEVRKGLPVGGIKKIIY